MTELPGPHLAAQDVDLHLAERDRRDERQIRPRGATGDDDRASEQLLGRERHRQDVVDAQVEGPQLRLEVAASRQPKGRGPALGQLIRCPQPAEEGRAVVVVHVQDDQLRVPVSQEVVSLREVLDGADEEHPVVEGELDEIDHQRPVVKHQGPLRPNLRRFRLGHTHTCVSCAIQRRDYIPERIPAGSVRGYPGASGHPDQATHSSCWVMSSGATSRWS